MKEPMKEGRKPKGPTQRAVLDALVHEGGEAALMEIVDAFIDGLGETAQAEVEVDPSAYNRAYANVASALTHLKSAGFVDSAGGIWRTLGGLPARAGVDAPAMQGAPPPSRKLGWRQAAVVLALEGQQNGRGKLREVIAGYVANLSPTAREELEQDPLLWEREYDAIATALTNLRRVGLVVNEGGIWRVADAESVQLKSPRAIALNAVREIVFAGELFDFAIADLGIDLTRLVAATAIWVRPSDNPKFGKPRYLARRARPGQGERRGEIVRELSPDDDGLLVDVRLDDNSYANLALKRALGGAAGYQGFEVCHIWPLTCYDVRYHTLLPNLVLLPRALAGLSDHSPQIQACLQFRAFSLFGWHPRENPVPLRPKAYPENWREPVGV